MNVCPYCSHDNQHEGPCARCGLEGNPSGTPWGIRKDRNTKYWNKYNWNSQTFTDGHGTKEPITAQERGNKINHDKIMGVIKPHKRGNLDKDPHFTASQPAMYDLSFGVPSDAEIEADENQPPEPEIPNQERPVHQQVPEAPPVEQVRREEVETPPQAEVEYDSEEEKFVPLHGLPGFRFVLRKKDKFPITFYHLRPNKRKEYGYEPDPKKRFPKGPKLLLPRGACLVELPNGMRIPFYSSSGSNKKPGVDPSDWLPLMGMGHHSPKTPDGYWFNKLRLPNRAENEYADCWEVMELQEVRRWLTNKWPGSKIINMVKHAVDMTNDDKIFYSQMFIEKYSPLPSPNNSPGTEHYEQYNKVLEDLKKVVKKDSPKPIK